jgi:hypothetical protein
MIRRSDLPPTRSKTETDDPSTAEKPNYEEDEREEISEYPR